MDSTNPHDRILETATMLFYQDGIQAVGINRIIGEADVALMTLYRHFGGKDELVAATLKQWSAHWLLWLSGELERRGDDPQARFVALWDALERWIAHRDFHGSFVANAAVELRGDPEHPAHEMIAAHRTMEHRLLEDLARLAGARDPSALAGQLGMLIDGAIAAAAVDHRPALPDGVRPLANAVLVAARH